MSNFDKATIACILTCHNRKEITLNCLRALFAATELKPSVVVVDDGSSDGTSIAVRAEFPSVVVVEGRSDLFWARGMHLAQSVALKDASPEYLLWLNDDTVLAKGKIDELIRLERRLASASGQRCIIVGSTASTESGTLTYGGAVSGGAVRRFRYQRVWSQDTPVECDVMNGNIVLIPRDIYCKVGSIDEGFEHAMGDTDYSLRARRAGFKIFVSPGISGYCEPNPPHVVTSASTHSLIQKWKAFTGRKRLPPRSWLRFTMRHGGLFWPLYFFQPYVRFLGSAFWSAIASKVRRSR